MKVNCIGNPQNVKSRCTEEGWAPGHSRGSHQEKSREELRTINPFFGFRDLEDSSVLE
jgi:hypothetical protein